MREDIRPGGSHTGGGGDAGGRGEGRVVIVVVLVDGGSGSLQTDGNKGQGQSMKIDSWAVVGLDAAGACTQQVSEEGRWPAGQKLHKEQHDGGDTGEDNNSGTPIKNYARQSTHGNGRDKEHW